MRVLITGASGYLGRHLVQDLSRDFELTASDLVPSADLPEGVRWIPCDVVDEGSVKTLVAGHDAVVHTVAIVRDRAGVPISRFLQVIVGGTWNVLEAAAITGVTRVVNISSVLVGGIPTGLDHPMVVGERYPGNVRDRAYQLSKTMGETVTDIYRSYYPELSVVDLRPGIIAGDGANADPVRVDEPFWFMHVDVRDLVLAVRTCLETNPPPSGTYQVVAARSDSKYSWREAHDEIGFVARHCWDEI